MPPPTQLRTGLDLADLQLRRCTACGAWRYADQPCTTGCLTPAAAAQRKAAA